MKIHEYQAKKMYRKYRVSVPEGGVAFNADEAIKVAKGLGKIPVFVKAQIHAGGRGKGGGVKLAKTFEEVGEITTNFIGMKLVTHQTGPEGQRVKKVLIEEALDICKEFYLSIFTDRATATNVIMASESGGMDIEDDIKKRPEKIISVSVNPLLGIQDYHCRSVAFKLNLSDFVIKTFTKTLKSLYRMFIEYDCSLLEINPLVLTVDDQIVALDAKVEVDSNALYRQKVIFGFRDIDEEDPLEVEASRYNLNYINLGGDGNIGSMVNGAGLAMATMDIIKQAGAEPANFLDVGGGASSEMVERGFKIILSDSNVKGILINIFGGILRCDVLARGVVEAAKKIDVDVPLIVRMEGTNVEEGRSILLESGLNLIMVRDLKETACQVAKIVSG